jgi:hypothetical protein
MANTPLLVKVHIHARARTHARIKRERERERELRIVVSCLGRLVSFSFDEAVQDFSTRASLWLFRTSINAFRNFSYKCSPSSIIRTCHILSNHLFMKSEFANLHVQDQI